MVDGHVISPGLYPIGSETEAEFIIEAANGLRPDANFVKLEISNPKFKDNLSTRVMPGAKIFVPSINSKSKEIKVQGSIENIRNFGYRENMTLKDIFYSKRRFFRKRLSLFRYNKKV